MNQQPQYPSADPASSTQPIRTADTLSQYQPIRVRRQPAPRSQRNRAGCTCGCLIPVILLFLGALIAYLIFPLKINLLMLGIDRPPAGTWLGRSDTIMLMQVNPLQPDVHMLSIPRDLWVPLSVGGENRINTAHFFAEANKAGSGPQAAIDTIAMNFGVRAQYYARVRFDGFKDVVNAMGGIDINLDKPMANLPAGSHHLNGDQALAFVRDRKGKDDFFRMADGQFLVIAAAKQFINPLTWPRIPAVAAVFFTNVDTNLPFWQWPRIAVALLRGGLTGIDHRTITREMVKPFITDQGADVLGPRWELIKPMIQDMFGVK